MKISYQAAMIRRERIMRAVEELGLLHDIYRLDDSCDELTATVQDAIILCGRQLEILNPVIAEFVLVQENTDRHFEKMQADRIAVLTPVMTAEQFEEFSVNQDGR